MRRVLGYRGLRPAEAVASRSRDTHTGFRAESTRRLTKPRQSSRDPRPKSHAVLRSDEPRVLVLGSYYEFVASAAPLSRVRMLRPDIAQRRTAGGSLCAPPFALATPAMNAASTRRDLTVLGRTPSRVAKVRRSEMREVISGCGIGFLVLSHEGLFADAKVVVV